MEPSPSSNKASSSSSSTHQKRKHHPKKSSSSDAGSNLDRQQRRELRHIKKSLKKYDPKSLAEINREQQNQGRTNTNVNLTTASTSSVSASSNSQIIRSNRALKKEHRRQEKREKRSRHQDNLSDELRHYLGSAIKNSLGHMHDHIIATLPTEMSLYYQKVHDTLVFDANHDGNNDSNPTSGRQMMNEMHEFITADVEASSNRPSSSSNPAQQEQISSNVNSSRSNYHHYSSHNPYAPPMHKPGILPIKDFLHDPFNASLNTLNRVTNLVRVPTSQIYSHGYNILNNLASPVNVQPSTLSTVPGTAERIVRRDNDDGIPAPPPVLPLIQCTHHQTRLEPLDLEEFNVKTWTIETLRQRVFQGVFSEKFRLQIWPYILGLYDGDNDDEDCRKPFDWSSRQKLFEHYRSQWQSILPEQEKRFMLFREQRDVIRCDRTHPFYNGDRNENLEKLKEILLTYMMYDFDTGYVQGMSDLVSPLLYVAEGDTCKAFWFFVQTMEFTVTNNESVNCYFAFRWIVCQFKREFMKSNSDDYQEVLLLWESIWTCSSMRKYFKNLLRQQRQQSAVEQSPNSNDQVSSTSESNIDNSQSEDVKNEESDLAIKIDEQCKIVDEQPTESDD
ncbi:TBC1 domain family member 15-like protein, partial [Euroglyphus maynei]